MAPTWRGPLPTALGPHRAAYAMLETLVRLPMLGPLLYRANTTRGFIGFMYRRHVFAEQTHVTEALLQRKQNLSRQPGALGLHEKYPEALAPALLAFFKEISKDGNGESRA